LPPARSLPYASQPHDFGPTMSVALVGLAVGSLLPLLTVPFRAPLDRASSPSRHRAFAIPASVALVPAFDGQSTGLGLAGAF
jgi:hypothetical protein